MSNCRKLPVCMMSVKMSMKPVFFETANLTEKCRYFPAKIPRDIRKISVFNILTVPTTITTNIINKKIIFPPPSGREISNKNE